MYLKCFIFSSFNTKNAGWLLWPPCSFYKNIIFRGREGGKEGGRGGVKPCFCDFNIIIRHTEIFSLHQHEIQLLVFIKKSTLKIPLNLFCHLCSKILMTWIHLKENHLVWPYSCTGNNILELSSIYIFSIKRLSN